MPGPLSVQITRFESFTSHNHLTVINPGMTEIKMSSKLNWRGGWWERLIWNVKEPLLKVLGKALLSYAELTTVLTRIEAVINTRPLTTASDDVRDPTPIMPAHLALGRSLFDLSDLKEVPVNEDTTRQRYLYQQRLVNHFWKRWRGECLHQLSIQPKWNEEQPALSVGDVVLISEDNVSRGKWQMGRVETLFPGKDGLVCTVELKTQKGNLCRAIQRLHQLKALGICWNTITDSFLLNILQSVLKMNDPEMKRSLLSIASRIFDPRDYSPRSQL
ncbi:uncharacterized protein LOC110062796 [Orbicella faveolata]|uniref:uncharacterized protein LOC110062796 n=1 Tax=Orbicella faveolata TaxID=48498 RepID=UPI0009E4EA7F|nr:uncharacterized protein LOC110062796 [Orbicella faveolata]